MFVLIIGFCSLARFHAPFVARYANGKIKNGMTISEVKQSLNGLGKYHIYCEVDKKGQVDTLFDDAKCEEVISGVLNQHTDNVRMTVIFMGPVFLKNDFCINFGGDGKVKAVTVVRSWD